MEEIAKPTEIEETNRDTTYLTRVDGVEHNYSQIEWIEHKLRLVLKELGL